MIAQCPSCSAKFRVADEKVPDKGVKVRCTKCATVFKVTRAEAAPPAPGGADDFGLGLAPSPPPAPPPAAPPAPSARRSQSFDIGESTGPVPLPAAGSFGHLGAHSPPVPNTTAAVSLPYGAASPQNSLDLDLSLGPPAAPPAPRPGSSAFRPPPAPAQNSSMNALDAALDAAMASSTGGFDLGDLGGPPQPPAYQAPPPASPPARPPARPPAPSAAAADPFANLSLDTGGGHDPFADLGLSAEAPPPPPPPPPPPARPPPRAPPAKAPAPKPAPAPAPAPDLGAHDPFAIDAGADDGPGLELNAPPAFARAPAPSQPPSALEMSNPFAELSNPPPAPPPPEPAAALPEPTAPPEPAAEQPPTPARGANNEFDFGSDDAPLPETADAPPSLPADLARIQLSRSGADKSASSAAPVPDAGARRRAEVLSAFFNVGSAVIVGIAALVSIALIRSPRPLTGDDFGFPLVWIALGLDTGANERLVRTTNVRTSAFPTRAGADVFVVRGDVENTGNAPRGAVFVVTELVRAGQAIARAESVAGLNAGPESIYLQDSRRNDELQLTLAKEATTIDLLSNASLPFVAILPVSAAEAAGCTVRLSIQDGVPAGMEGAFAPGVLPSERKEAPTDAPPATDAAPGGAASPEATPDAGASPPADGTR